MSHQTPQTQTQTHHFRLGRRRPSSFKWIRCVVLLLVGVACIVPLWTASRIYSRRRLTSAAEGKGEGPIDEVGDRVKVEEGKEEANRAELRDNAEEDRKKRPVHFIYTIGCGGASDSYWQLLQSNALDSSFRAVRQRGKLTRLVSGCVDDPGRQEDISRSVLDADQLNVVFVQSQDRVVAGREKRTYVQANRPTALQLFFALPEIVNANPETVYVVLDPDFIFRKAMPEDAIEAVKEKRFVTQFYSLMDPQSYAANACKEALNGTDRISDCNVLAKRTKSYRGLYAGVPYMLLRQDWLDLLSYWIPLIGPVLLRYPGIESDMISWSIAAAVAKMEPAQQRHDFMATCMCSEKADVDSIMSTQVFLHLCQSYYVPETRAGDQFKVNRVAELGHIVRPGQWLEGITYVFIFNKHWLRRSNLLDDCGIPLLLEAPPIATSESFAQSPYYKWHLFVLNEAIPFYNRAVVEFRKKFHGKECVEGEEIKQTISKQALIMHETHRSRHGGGWNHVIDLVAH